MIRVLIIESERGWGQRVAEIRIFATLAKAEQFCEKFDRVNSNRANKSKVVPDWYMFALIEESEAVGIPAIR